MKVEREERPPVQPPALIHITLTEPEAEFIAALLGGIRGKHPFVRELFDALDESLPGRTVSFIDLFSGEVRAK